MKAENLKKIKWQYIFVFALPWILVLIHSVLRSSWLVGDGSILYKDAGNLYVQLYSELWDKVHNGGSLAFSWASGFGVEFGLSILRYLMSPFTLIILLVPRTMIATMVQVLMVLKWSLLSVSMLYYVSHTKNNKLKNRKTIMCVMLAMMYFLSNVVIAGLHDLSYLDVMIVFPLLLLLEERMIQGKGYKRFYVLFTLTVLMNYQLAIPVAIFLLLWFVMQFEKNVSHSKKNVVSFVVTYILAIVSGMVVVIPNLLSGMGFVADETTAIASFTELIQRFFVCDTLLYAQAEQPMLYCSLVAVLLAMLYIFTDVSIKKKMWTCILLILLALGMLSELCNSIWNGTLRISSEFLFMLVFMIVYMSMETVARLESIRMWQIVMVGLVGIVGCVLGFFTATILLEFYVYLATILIVVFTFLMLVFYKKQSIQYQNVLIVFAIVGLIELTANAVFQLKDYNEYELENTYYHQSAENLTNNLSLEEGERIAMVQGMYNYGMNLQKPTTSWQQAIGNRDMSRLCQELGMEWSSDGSAFHGGSPLMNVMFNVRYGLGQNEMPFSDCTQIKSANNSYNLYEMNRLAGLGYMVNSDVKDWNIESYSPFELQNDFVKRSTGGDEIFEILAPDAICQSMAGVNPDEEHEHLAGEEEHEHSHSHDDKHEFYRGEYLYDMYYYHFQKIYADDMVNYTFQSDGVSDYYIYVEGADKSICYVQIKGEYVYWDQFASEQKTIHVGVVPKGTMISVISNFEIDGMDYSEIRYQVAAFNEDAYAAAYNQLSSNTLQINELTDEYVKGNITAEQDGIMLTSIPAYEGMSVVVDGDNVEYHRIGNALIGIPLNAGEHAIVIEYNMPYLQEGIIASVVGVILFVLFCGFQFLSQKKNRLEE